MGLVIDASSPATVTGNPTATTASFTPPDDSVLVIGWAGNAELGVTPGAPTITDSLGGHLTYTLAGWHSRGDDPVGHPDGQAAMWTAQVITGAAMTVSVTNNAASARHGALKVWVVTGAAVGTVGEGGNGFSTTTAAQSYTATADGSQGFMAVGDWDATGTETAGSGCTMDSSGTIAGPQISYGFLRRTTADGANGGLTTLTANLPGSSISLNWAYVELTPLVGDPAEKDPPPFIWWCPPGPNAPNGAILPWSGTADAPPPDTGIRIHENSPGVALNTAGTATATTTASFTPPAGSLLLVLWAGNSTSGANPTAPTITDSLGSPLTYTQTDWISRASSPNADGQAAAWTAPVTSAAPMTVTVNNNATSPNRHAALQVVVLVNQNATPVGAHGKLSSISAAQIAQTYTASATGGQGFIAVCDWTANTQTQGMDCYTANPNSRGVIAGQISYGMFKRTVPDDVAAQSNRLNVQLSGTSTDLSWVYVEILPAAGGTAEVGTTLAALTASGAATKVASCSGTSSLALTAAGAARKTSTAAGAAVAALTAAGAATVAGARQQSGSCTVALTSAGSARKSALPTGTAIVALTTVGSARKTAVPAGAAVVALRASAAAAKSVSRTGTAALALRAVGSAAKTAPVASSSVVALRATGAGTKLVSRTGAATLALAAAATSAVARQQTGTCAVAVTTSAAARKVAAATGTARATLAAAGVQVKRSTPAGSAVLAPRSAGAARKTSTPTSSGTLALRCAGAPAAVRTQAGRCVAALGSQAAATALRAATGRGLLALQAHSFVGAPPPPPPVGMDQGTATAPLLSGTATPGPTLGGDVGTGITSDVALVVASSLG